MPVFLDDPPERLKKTISQDYNVEDQKDKDQDDDGDTNRDDLLGRDCQDEGVADEGQGQRAGQVVEVSVPRVPHQVDQCCLE